MSENTEETWHKRQELSVPVAYASEIHNIPLCEPQIQESMKFKENLEVTKEINYRDVFEVKKEKETKKNPNKNESP